MLNVVKINIRDNHSFCDVVSCLVVLKAERVFSLVLPTSSGPIPNVSTVLEFLRDYTANRIVFWQVEAVIKKAHFTVSTYT